MFNPFDMMQGQGGAGMQGFGQQFGLTPDQTRRAMEALMPAFALGLQRDAGQDPAGLLKLFTSPVLSQAVIRQAATASGVGGQALRQMLPMMAGMVVASVVHMLLNQPQAQMPAARPEPEPANPFLAGQAFWTDMMKGFLPAAAEPAPAPAPEPPRKPARAEEPASGWSPSGKPSKGLDVFQQMLLTGAEVQEENVKAMKGIFDAFWTESATSRVSAPSKASASARPRKAAPKASVDSGTRPGRP